MPTRRFRRSSSNAFAGAVAFALASLLLGAVPANLSAAGVSGSRAKSATVTNPKVKNDAAKRAPNAPSGAASAVQQQAGDTAVGPSARGLVAAAKAQIGVTTIYDPAYVKLAYPGGDVSPERGVCTDVIVRAYRSIGVDLQVLVHNDMAKNFSRYPRSGMRAPDKNIDHRRVKNLAVFYARQGAAVPITQNAADYRPGDIVDWDLSGLAHTGLVSDVLVPGTDRYQIVHNVGAGTQLEDVLFEYPITGHFRFLPGATASMNA